MGCGQSRGSREQEEVELQSQRLMRQVETLEQLGYYAQPLGLGDNPMGGHQIDFYTIWHPDRRDPEGYIAILAACRNTGTLVVSHIYTIRDPRRPGTRPLASDIFLSFWHYFLQIPVEYLCTVFIDTVREDSMEQARPIMYGLLRKDLGERLCIRRGGDREGEKDAFKLACITTKFGRCVKTMEKENAAMKTAKMEVSQFTVDPHNAGSSDFDLIIDFKIPSVQRTDEGHRRRRRR